MLALQASTGVCAQISPRKLKAKLEVELLAGNTGHLSYKAYYQNMWYWFFAI